MGFVLSNQVRFEDKGFLFGVGYNPFNVVNVRQHEHCRTMSWLGPAVEITANAVGKDFCLPHVNDFPGGVLHQVNAGTRWELFKPLLNRFEQGQLLESYFEPSSSGS